MSVRILKILLGLIFLPIISHGQPLVISTETEWQGVVEMTSSMQISATGRLHIAAGTRVIIINPAHSITVHGQILIEGTEAQPVIFDAVSGWKGIQFIEAKPGSRIVEARFSDCDQAIGIIATSPEIRDSHFINCTAAVKLLRESNAEIVNNLFTNNGLGLGIEMRSSPRVAGNQFVGHKNSGIVASNNSRGLIENNIFKQNEQGVGLLQKYPDKVRNNDFIENKVGLYCYQTQNTPLIEGNLFQKNEHGLVNFSFSFPAVKNNRFFGNKTALQNDQFGSALVEYNLFKENGTAIYNNRKSNPKIRMNSFSDNELALFVDYSSYPLVRKNNFNKTAEGARLGIYQSADWEKRSGSKQLVMKNAKQRKSQNAMLGQAPTEYTDIVDLSGNWWGEMTAQLDTATADQNLTFFYDRKDMPMVTYEGFGPDSYRLDEILFQPVLKSSVAGTGPVK